MTVTHAPARIASTTSAAVTAPAPPGPSGASSRATNATAMGVVVVVVEEGEEEAVVSLALALGRGRGAVMISPPPKGVGAEDIERLASCTGTTHARGGGAGNAPKQPGCAPAVKAHHLVAASDCSTPTRWLKRALNSCLRYRAEAMASRMESGSSCRVTTNAALKTGSASYTLEVAEVRHGTPAAAASSTTMGMHSASET